MKELSIEEKAKRYDEALKQIKECTPDENGFITIYPQEIFPELKESEDERIKEDLIQWINEFPDTIWRGHYKKDVIAWLEKQGEQKPAFCHHEVDLSECSEEYRKAYYDGWNNCNQQHVQLEAEQKPAWSEKDDNCLSTIIAEFSKCAGKSVSKDEWMRCNDFLNSLRDRVQPQPKQEWSEEDEDNFKHLMDEIVCLSNSRNSANRLYYDKLIKFLDELKNRAQPREEWRDKDKRMLDRLIAYFEKQVAFTDDDNPRYANWLKSLRPQNTWKPSEEQLDMLAKVCSTLHLTTGENEIMESIYDALKKLK